MALERAATAFEGENQAAIQAAAAHDAALKDATVAQDRCKALEVELQGLHDEHAKEARNRQEKEEDMKTREAAAEVRDAKLDERHGQLDMLEQALESKRIELDGKVRVLAEDRVDFALLEERSRATLKALYDKGLEKPLTTDEDGPA